MAVTTVDLVVYKAAGGTSDNGAKSATALASGVQNGLWPDLSDAVRLAGGTRIKKWFLANEALADSLSKPTIYNAIVPAGVTEELGLGFDSTDDNDNAQGNMSAFSGNAVAALVSTAPDTRSVTLYGLSAAGQPQFEVVVMTGTSEKLSTLTWSKLYAAVVSALATNTISIKQGSAGTVRGTIGSNKKACWLWITAVSALSGLFLPTLANGANYGFWDRQTWPAGTGAARNTLQRIALVETN